MTIILQADFSNTPYENNTFDKIYAIEATCHAPEKIDPYSEAFRVIKPGGLYAIYEWVMTDKYNPKNAYHKKIKEEIMVRFKLLLFFLPHPPTLQIRTQSSFRPNTLVVLFSVLLFSIPISTRHDVVLPTNYILIQNKV